jgi:Uma2 family endonuclease
MLAIKAPPITRYDYQEMPLGPPYYQVIEGDLVMSPSPNTFHQYIAGNIHRLLGNFLDKHPLGEVFVAPLDVYLTDTNVFQPDVVYISQARRSLITEQGIEGAPDLVVEVLSPGTARYDQGSKRKAYARNGVRELWIVHPQTKLLQVYHLEKDADAPLATYGEKAQVTSPLLPGLKIKTAAVFRSPLGR